MAKKSIQEALSLPIFAENGNRTPFTNQQYAEGFEAIGSTPPEATLFNDILQTIELKAQWTALQLITAIRARKPEFSPNDLETTNLKDLLEELIGGVDLSKLVTIDTEQKINGKKTFNEINGNGGRLATEQYTKDRVYELKKEKDVQITNLNLNIKDTDSRTRNYLAQYARDRVFELKQQQEANLRATQRNLEKYARDRAFETKMQVVENIRLSDIQVEQLLYGQGFFDDGGNGWVITGIWSSNRDNIINGVSRRRVQKRIGGNWYNIGTN